MDEPSDPPPRLRDSDAGEPEPGADDRRIRSAFPLLSGRLRAGWLPALVLLGVLVLQPVLLFVVPPQTAPAHADVAFVIGPPDQWRIDWAERLVDDGTVSAIMISVQNDTAAGLCGAGEYHGATVLCARPDPFTTQGEARWLAAEFAQRGWHSGVVITMSSHVERARLYFSRCIPDGVQVVGRQTARSLSQWVSQVTYQVGAFAKALLVTTTC